MDDFMKFIEQLIEEYEMEEQKLLKTGCKDEANFAKIRINICDICKTIYNVSLKQVFANEPVSLCDEEKRKRFIEDYLGRLTKTAKNWEIAYEKAKEHGDVEKIVIEEIKLEVFSRIKNTFNETIGKK